MASCVACIVLLILSSLVAISSPELLVLLLNAILNWSCPLVSATVVLRLEYHCTDGSGIPNTSQLKVTGELWLTVMLSLLTDTDGGSVEIESNEL